MLAALFPRVANRVSFCSLYPEIKALGLRAVERRILAGLMAPGVRLETLFVRCTVSPGFDEMDIRVASGWAVGLWRERRNGSC